jgi:hypothetical protein
VYKIKQFVPIKMFNRKKDMMKNRKKLQLLTSLIMMIACILPGIAMAQTDPGCGPDCPIDGGLSLLLAAGAGYGIKKYRDARKKGKEELEISN